MKKTLLVAAAIMCCILCNAEVKEPDSYNYRRGVEALREGETEKGIEMLNREIKDHPKCGYAYMWLAAGEGTRSEYGKAMTAINYALKYLPKKDKGNMSWAYRIRAMVNLSLEDTVAAIADYTQAIKLKPDVYDYYDSRADVYFELRQYDLSNDRFAQCSTRN